MRSSLHVLYLSLANLLITLSITLPSPVQTAGTVLVRRSDDGMWHPERYGGGAPKVNNPPSPGPALAASTIHPIPSPTLLEATGLIPFSAPLETTHPIPSSLPVEPKEPLRTIKEPEPHESPLISADKFNKAMTAANFPVPSSEQHVAFVASTKKAKITSALEAAMYLAHLLWESHGLQEVVERACVNSACPGSYISDLDVKGKRYFGRGYIQLTWAKNYLEASKGIYEDDRLLQHPEMVSENSTVSWETAAWYWGAKVHDAAASGNFGRTTAEINGPLECRGGWSGAEAARSRFRLFTTIAPIFGAPGPFLEAGCY
ncbi:lysozyme-like domain-containing protein [Piptocephalis cylindrospora]|uniref:Lysozyme-like domain-containing protein n=1 Tax=Piptocephalis cylindrospora TaxID=1907219 RepID=A0A4P9Y3S5_9FUNG|nr:lysozyme-like domain-containing protein [Piptocephalis cylindrospora]|eukprot:RKP12460.1 lysozyme-like domain-containing protein [Piptocephalis cylindrospora]